MKKHKRLSKSPRKRSKNSKIVSSSDTSITPRLQQNSGTNLLNPDDSTKQYDFAENFVLRHIDGLGLKPNQVTLQPSDDQMTETIADDNFSSVKMNTVDQGEKYIRDQKQINKLEKSQFDTTEEYINKLRFSIDLDQSLYKLYDSCAYNQQARFCPVLIETSEEFYKSLKNMERGPAPAAYLLQVWSAGGKLIFERPLEQPPQSWNVHGEYFVFQEAHQENYDDKLYLLEMSETMPCKLFRLLLPALPTKTHGKHHQGGSFKAPAIVTEDPRRIKRTIGIAKDYVLVCRDQKIYYTNIEDIRAETPRSAFQRSNFFKIDERSELLEIFDIGNNETAMLVKDENQALYFYQFKKIQRSDSREMADVQLVRLGHKNQTHEAASPPVQIRLTLMPDESKVYHTPTDTDSKEKSFTCSLLVLRENGSFEFYCNFNLVSMSEKAQICERIETDDDGYLLLMRGATKEERILKEVGFSWGNLIGTSVASKVQTYDLRGVYMFSDIKEQQKAERRTQKKIENEFASAHHRKISGYFKLFTQFFNYGTFMYVAHREFVSVFDLKNLTTGATHLHYDDQVSMLAQVAHKKGISVLLASQQWHEITEDEGCIQTQLAPIEMTEKIVQISTDHQNDTAIFMLTQVCSVPYHYQTYLNEASSENRFRQQEPWSESSTLKLLAMRGHTMSELVIEDLNLNLNTQIKVFYDDKSNSHLIISNSDQSYTYEVKTSQESDEVWLDVTKQKKYYHRLKDDHSDEMDVSTDSSNNKSETEIDLLKEIDQNCLPGKLIGAVLCEGSEFGRRTGFMARITTRAIEVYNREGKLQEYYTNPHIIESVLVDQSYIYCLCERSTQPIKKYDLKKQQVYTPSGATKGKQLKGIYVYDIERLLKQGQIENYRLARAVVGQANNIDFSESSGRITYFTNFKEISMLPFPHRNTINFLGMGEKKDYLIWREKDGFFTGLHNSGQLRVWSLSSGKFIGTKLKTDIAEVSSKYKVNVLRLSRDYKIFKAHSSDTCYDMGFQNHLDHTIQLLKREEPEIELKAQKGTLKNTDFTSNLSHIVQTVSPKYETSEFLVLSLATTEDLDFMGVPFKSTQVQILFRFKFPLPTADKEQPTMHFSQNLEKLMVVSAKQHAVIYARVEPSDQQLTRHVEWVQTRKIQQYPTLLQGQCTLPFLFDPDFERYIDVDYAQGHFVIKSVEDPTDVKIISKSLLSLQAFVQPSQTERDNQNLVTPKEEEHHKQLKIQNEESIALIAKRLHFKTSSLIRIINTEGIDMLFDIKLMKVVAFAKQDNLTIERVTPKMHKHFILEKDWVDDSEVLTRLVRRCQSYKSAIEFAKYDLTLKEFSPRMRYREPNLLSFLYRTDHSATSFQAEASFTLLDWIIAERVLNDALFDFNDIDRSQQIQLCFNIFPKSKTILHKLALSAESSERITTESEDSITQKLFSVCKRGLPHDQQYFRRYVPFEIPLLQDLNGKTVLDIAFYTDDNSEKGLRKRFWDLFHVIFPKQRQTIFKHFKRYDWFQRVMRYGNKQSINIFKRRQNRLNTQLAYTIFSNLQSYSFLHSSSVIHESVISAAGISMPGIGEYLDSRLVESEHQPSPMQNDLQKQALVPLNEYCHTADQYTDNESADASKWIHVAYKSMEAQLWADKVQIEQNLFRKDGVQKRMILKYLDVPLLHQNRDEGQRFMQALRKDMTFSNLEIYSKRSIQMLIMEHWQRSQWKLLILEFIPYCIMLCFFSLWSNLTLKSSTDWQEEVWDPFRFTLMALSIYFLVIEFVLLVSHTTTYLMSPWTYIKVLPMCLVLYNAKIASDIEENVGLAFWQRQAFAGFFMWLRLLYFLRCIESFSYLIRIVIHVLVKIAIFLQILGVVVFGFADTFYSLSTSTDYMPADEPNSGRFITSYTNSLQFSYQIVLANWPEEMDQFDSLTWLFLILSTLMTFFVLANMLIQIVSDIYGEVADKKYLYVFRERVELICDLHAFSKIASITKQFLIYVYNLIYKKITKVLYHKGRKSTIDSGMKRKLMLQRCDLLMIAQEDPDNNDSILDEVQDENEITFDEKVEDVQSHITDMKRQLGLTVDQGKREIEIATECMRDPFRPMFNIADNLDLLLGGIEACGPQQLMRKQKTVVVKQDDVPAKLKQLKTKVLQIGKKKVTVRVAEQAQTEVKTTKKLPKKTVQKMISSSSSSSKSQSSGTSSSQSI